LNFTVGTYAVFFIRRGSERTFPVLTQWKHQCVGISKQHNAL